MRISIIVALFFTAVVSTASLSIFARKAVTKSLRLSSSANKYGIASIFIAQLLAISSPAIAAVGEGELPDGAMAFAKVRKYQNEWDKLAQSVKTRGSADIDEKEIISIKFFLKQLANEYFDMEVISVL